MRDSGNRSIPNLGQHLKLGKEKLGKEKVEKVDTRMESCFFPFGEAKHGKSFWLFCRVG